MLLKEVPNASEIRIAYIAALDAYMEVDVDKLTRNDLGQILNVAHSSIKSKQEKGISNYDILMRTKMQTGVSKAAIDARIAEMSEDELNALFARIKAKAKAEAIAA